MKLSRVFAIVLTAFLVMSTLFVVSVSFVKADPVFKQVLGIVDPNSVTAVAAYDSNPADNGWTYFYIQNRTNEGTGTDPMTQIGAFDVYDPEIYVNISDWKVDDECINVVNRDYGTYGVDHAGYVAFMNTTLTTLVGTDIAPNTELLKIPTPTFGAMDVGYINVDWTGLSDPNGLIAGYTLYRSESNGTASGDADWLLIGGTVAAPLTGMTFNDTGVIGGTDYFYSLKVVFIGYQNNNPGSVDNYECAYFGEGTPLVTAPVSSDTVDYIVVEYGDTTPVTTIDIDVGMTTVTVYAQGYNTTGGLVGAVVADWTVNPPGLGDCSPTPSSSTQFTANFQGGAATVTATYGSFTDDFTVNINPPGIDYIVLEYASNSTEIMDMNWNVGDGLVVQAAGYNNTGPTRIGLQTVTWENITIDTGTGSFSLYSADISTFTGNWPGLIEIRGTYTPGIFDNFTLGLVWGIPPTVDSILITDNAGVEITSLTLDILQTTEVFAWGFNVSAGSLGNVEVDWISETGGTVDVATGLSTNFTAGTSGGLVNITATYGSFSDDLGVTINPPTVDYISITDGPDGLDVVSELIHVSGFVDLYASGYNNSGDTYVGLVVVTWSMNVTGLGTLDPTTPADMTKFTGSGAEGYVMITADDGSGHNDTVDVELQILTTDYILLTDGEGGPEIDSATLNVGEEIMIYASGYNNTGGGTFTELVVVDWTQAPNTLGDFSAASGSSVTFTAGLAGGETSITGTVATFDDSFLLTINDPTVDYVIIRNESDNGGIEVESDTFKLVEGETVSQTYYCAGYNDTAGYVEDVAADWSFDTVVGTLVPAAGQLTLFTATTAGTATLTADSGGMTDTIEIIVQPADDTTAPAPPTGLAVTVGTAEKTLVITWNANTELDLSGYWLYRSTSETGTYTKLNSALLTDTTYTDTGLEYETTYYYKVSAEDNATNESPQTTAVSGTTAAEVVDGDGDGEDGDDEFPVVLLLIPLILIIIVILLFLMMKKKKPEEAPPAEEEEKELPPPPGAKEEVEEVEAVEEEEDVPPPEDEEGEEALEEDEEKPPEE